MVLFRLQELGELIQTFTYMEKNKWTADSRKLVKAWKETIRDLTGEEEGNINDSLINYDKLIFGITRQNDHKLLRKPLKEIQEANFKADEIEELMQYLKKQYHILRKARRDQKRHFDLFGEKYIWVKATELP